MPNVYDGIAMELREKLEEEVRNLFVLISIASFRKYFLAQPIEVVDCKDQFEVEQLMAI